MKKIIALLLPILILCSLTACGSSTKIRFGTAGIGGNYYLFGQTLAEYAKAPRPGRGIRLDRKLRMRVWKVGTGIGLRGVVVCRRGRGAPLDRT